MAIEIKNNGKSSTAIIPNNPADIHKLKESLTREGFNIVSQSDEKISFIKKMTFSNNDWPINLSLENLKSESPIIIATMFIPNYYLIFIGILVFPIILLVVLTGKHKFDLSTNALWQGTSRRKWNKKLRTILEQSFNGKTNNIE